MSPFILLSKNLKLEVFSVINNVSAIPGGCGLRLQSPFTHRKAEEGIPARPLTAPQAFFPSYVYIYPVSLPENAFLKFTVNKNASHTLQ